MWSQALCHILTHRVHSCQRSSSCYLEPCFSYLSICAKLGRCAWRQYCSSVVCGREGEQELCSLVLSVNCGGRLIHFVLLLMCCRCKPYIRSILMYVICILRRVDYATKHNMSRKGIFLCRNLYALLHCVKSSIYAWVVRAPSQNSSTTRLIHRFLVRV